MQLSWLGRFRGSYHGWGDLYDAPDLTHTTFLLKKRSPLWVPTVPDPGGGRDYQGTVRQSNVGQSPRRRAVPAVELNADVFHLFPARRK